jgi:signal transduction histidine kinase
MPSRSLFANRSSTSVAPPLVGAAAGAAIVGAIGWATGRTWLAAAGLAAAAALAGAFAVFLIVSERRRHVVAEDALQAQASFLESLVDAIAAVSSSLDADEILERTRAESQRLFGADRARILGPDEPGEGGWADGQMVLPLLIRSEAIGAIALERREPFHRWDLMRGTVLADFASRAIENARLIAEAHEREVDRGRLAERLITAEQDERRRLALFLHDGALQSMSGIALMHDAALAAIEEGRGEDAARVLATSLQLERETIRELRDLSFALEPVVLRDAGFAAAVEALGDQIAKSHRIELAVDVAAGDRFGEKAQTALYQVIRESLSQAVRRGPTRIDVTVAEAEGAFRIEIADDGRGERRRRTVEELEERVKILNGELVVENHEAGGTTVTVTVPAYSVTTTS